VWHIPFRSIFCLRAHGQALQAVCALALAIVAALPIVAQSAPESIHGEVRDREGAVCEGARVALTEADAANPRIAVTDEQGRYIFGNVAKGAFSVTVSANGFTSQTMTGEMTAGASLELRPAVLLITSAAEIEVTANLHEVAQAQLGLQEQQRVLGVMPNFYVSYAQRPVALTPRQKFQLAWRNEIDPMTFLSDAAGALIEQAGNTPKSWGQGTSGYAKRYAAAYGDDLIGTMVGSALLPSLLHQDPRYFYKGMGSKMSRVLYAIRSSVVCRGDNGRWQADYSRIAGDLASAGISNLYYPAANRNGLQLTLRNMLIDKATGAAENVVQEFLIRRLTPKATKDNADTQ
jgi:Carboxypeptidase regulatory-like domain